MKHFRLGLNLAGQITYVLDVVAEDVIQAGKSWSVITGHNDDLYNEKEMTYFGWQLVKTKLPALQRKSDQVEFHSVVSPE